MKTSPPPGSAGPVVDRARQVAAMREALAAAGRGYLAGEPPIGACVVRDGEVLAVAHTAVVGGPDATAHAEILALRAACRQQRTPSLAGCELYATVEPCAMCLAASHYAGITQVWFGAALDTLQAVTGREVRGAVPAGMQVTGGILSVECAGLLEEWSAALKPARR